MSDRIFSPMTEGNGAIVAHRYLESGIPGYQVKGVSPITALLGPGLKLALPVPAGTGLIHSVPDLACFFQRPGLPSVVSFQNYILDAAMASYSSVFQRVYYRTALRAYHRRSVAKADVITAVSRFTADLAIEDLQINKPVEVIHNAVDHRLFTPALRRQRGARLRVLVSGNPTLRKGFQYLPEIARGLPENVELLVASGLRGQSPVASGRRNIHHLGSVPFAQMPDLYRSVDLCLAPFFREGLCLSVLEAMASGLPVIAFDASSMPELVEHGKGGFLTPIGNVPAMLAAIKNYCEQPSLLTQMGEYNRAVIESSFTLETMRSAYMLVFEPLLGVD